MLQMLQDLDGAGVDVHSLTEPQIDTTTSTDRALFAPVAVCLQLHVNAMRQNTRDRLARARVAGRVGGRSTVRIPERVSATQKFHAEGFLCAGLLRRWMRPPRQSVGCS
jgi:DNA invertase Pin-like site-specific DNA recombinase